MIQAMSPALSKFDASVILRGDENSQETRNIIFNVKVQTSILDFAKDVSNIRFVRGK
jgi:hypothetical protein